eukprot:NODE_1340_length_1172_cov_380.264100.p1 GENE.NODE_1340_length_1172_cov_380.264100~~NODE_1340_length_1172_cov_380.264100.p1  ORF type:complete len:307 (+),score=88.61 NODE_1340_length_1172_cov_380.264100:116-1036(+)
MFVLGGLEATAAVEAGLRRVPPAREARGVHSGEVSEGGSSKSSAHLADTEEDDFKSTIPHLERLYEQLAAKARLPERHGASASSWVLSLARGYHRLSKDKRRRSRLGELLQPAAQAAVPGSCGVMIAAQPDCASTDDSGYEAGYETDAEQSEWSEWESGAAPAQRHKRKLDALVHLTMRLSVSERSTGSQEDAFQPPPSKTPRAFGTQPVGLRQPLPRAAEAGVAAGNAAAAPLCTGDGADVMPGGAATRELSGSGAGAGMTSPLSRATSSSSPLAFGANAGTAAAAEDAARFVSLFASAASMEIS